jgi:hypothetical protein
MQVHVELKVVWLVAAAARRTCPTTEGRRHSLETGGKGLGVRQCGKSAGRRARGPGTVD